MEEKLKITMEQGKYFVVFPSGSKVVMTEEANKKIMAVIMAVIQDEFSLQSALVEPAEEKKEIKATRNRPTDEEVIERRKLISSLFREGYRGADIIRPLSDKFGLSYPSAAKYLHGWLATVGHNNKSSKLSKWLAEHDYKLEGDLNELAEQFGLSVQDLKRTAFKIRDMFYID